MIESQEGNANASAANPVNQQNVVEPSRQQIEAQPVGKFNMQEVGATGTRIFGEIFDEEYLSKLSGMRRADVFDEMIRSDDTINMLLSARKNPILKATWSVEPAKGDTPQEEELFKRMAEHAEHELFTRMNKDFLEFVDEALTFIEHGYSLFERVHELVDDKKYGKYIGFKNIAFRSQRTIERWQLDRSGRIISVFQQADGDVGSYAHIQGQWVTVFSLKKRGDNYEGISALRPIYGNWQRKNLFLKLLAIGIERYAINTPKGTIPAGKEESPEKNAFINVLKSISSHQQNFVALPQGWAIDFLQNPFDVEKVVKAIQREDEGMVRSFVANHLNLGQGGSSGAYALGTDLSDQFLSIIENDAAIVTRRFNKELIKEFIDFNYGPQSKYPCVKVSGINDKFAKEFAEIMRSLADAKFLTPTENVERWARKRLGLPELLEADAAQVPDVRKFEKPSLFSEPDASVKFADLRTVKSKIKQQIDSSANDVAKAMQDELGNRAQAFINRLISAMKKEKREDWRKVIRNQGELALEGDYFKKIRNVLTETAGRAIAQARNEVPNGRKVEFCEGVRSRISLAETDDAFKKLPKKVRDLILTDADLAAGQQFGTLRSRLLISASNGVDETADLDVMKKRLKDEAALVLSGKGESGFGAQILTAATNLSSKVYNTTRAEFFNVPEVFDKIVAYQFVNSDPVSPICQDLNGRIFDKDDPSKMLYWPPLHHNCKSSIVPLFNLQGKEIDERGLKPSKSDLDRFKTL